MRQYATWVGQTYHAQCPTADELGRCGSCRLAEGKSKGGYQTGAVLATPHGHGATHGSLTQNGVEHFPQQYI